MRTLVVILLLTSGLTGCVGDRDEATALERTDDPAEGIEPGHSTRGDGAPNDALNTTGKPRTLTFEGRTEPGWRSPAGGSPGSRTEHRFSLDPGTRTVVVELSHQGSEQSMDAVLLDPDGRLQCQAATGPSPKRCSTPVPPSVEPEETWVLDIGPATGISGPGLRYVANVTMDPGTPVLGDPTEGTDPTMRFRVSDLGVESWEPTLGLLPDGTIFVQANLRTMRSIDDGESWEDVAPISTSQATFDPMLRVDPWSERVYVDQLTVACSVLAWSGDGGDSWITNPMACGLPVNDHQKLATGPSPLPGAPGPAVYYVYWDFAGGIWLSRSYDGGLTFTTTKVNAAPGGPVPGYTGPAEADRDGNVYISFYTCDGVEGAGVAVSHDHGATFQMVQAAELPGPCTETDPGIAVDAAGTVYLGFTRPDGAYVVASTDNGESWSEPVRVSPPSLGAFMHIDVAAGDPGRVAVAYRGTPDASDRPSRVDGWARWSLYVSILEGADGPHPELTTALATPVDDLVHRGAICQGFYPPCMGDSRNLGEFIDVAAGPDGRIYVAYDDGCDDPCPTPADSRASLGRVVIQQTGPRLFETHAPWVDAAVAAALLVPQRLTT